LNAVLERVGARENYGVRRPSERDLGDSAFEHDAVAGKRVERRRLDLAGAIAADVVGSNRIYSDENHVGRISARPRRGSKGRAQQGCETDQLEKALHCSSKMLSKRGLVPRSICATAAESAVPCASLPQL